MAIEARSLHVVVWSSHPLANEQMAEAIARVLSRYAVDLSSGVEVTMPHDGVNVTYVARAAINLASVLRAARTPPAGLGLNVPVAAQAVMGPLIADRLRSTYRPDVLAPRSGLQRAP
jgi:hypothetical protein